MSISACREREAMRLSSTILSSGSGRNLVDRWRQGRRRGILHPADCHRDVDSHARIAQEEIFGPGSGRHQGA